MTEISLIDELESTISSGTVERRIESLWHVTDLFITGAAQYSDDQIAVFDDVIGRLAVQIEAKARVKLAQYDIRNFDLGLTFPLIIAPFRVVQHLITVDDQLQFLGTAARHLTPTGSLIFDVFNPRFDALTSADGVEREDTPELQLPDGRTLRRGARVTRVRWVDQVSETELIYYVGGKRYVQAFDMRWYLAAELQHLLARGGFRVREMYGDFARGPLVDGSPEIVLISERS